MAIIFSCQCGKQIKVADKFAGRSGKCPACGGMITIPYPDPPDTDTDPDLIYEALGPKTDPEPQPAASGVCNACGKPMPAGSVLCLQCGFHSVSHTYLKVANAKDAKEKVAKAPLLSLGGVEFRWWTIALIVIPIAAVSFWYYTGPARDVLVLNVETVSVIESIHNGQTREPFSLFTQQGDLSLGIKAPKSKSHPNAMIGGTEETYSLGSSDKLIVLGPDESGGHIALQVALKQGTIRSMNRISGYDSIIKADDFKLVPIGGGKPVDARLLSKRFEKGAELDIGGAQTTNFRAMFPNEPTELKTERNSGTISGQAFWRQPNAKGEITFYASYPFGEYPAAKGLTANGKVELTSNAGTTVNMQYTGGTLQVDWDPDASGWWAKDKYTHMSQPSPWYRYHFGLLFKRPQVGGEYQLTYCGKHIATVSVDPAAPPKTPMASPMKRVNSKNKPASTSNPLAYFKVMGDARQQARGIVSASNLRQLGLGLQIYLDQHGQVWPDSLEQLEGVMSGYEQVMVNPRTGEEVGFIYVRPERGAEPSTTAVLFESLHGKPDPNGAILYADGHIE